MASEKNMARTYRVFFEDGRVADLPGTTRCTGAPDSLSFWFAWEAPLAFEVGIGVLRESPAVQLVANVAGATVTLLKEEVLADRQSLRMHYLYVATGERIEGRHVWAKVRMEEHEEEANRLRRELASLTEKRITLQTGTTTHSFSVADAMTWLAEHGWNEALALKSFGYTRQGDRPSEGTFAVEMRTTLRTAPADFASGADSVNFAVRAKVTGEPRVPLPWTREAMMSFVWQGPMLFRCATTMTHGWWLAELHVGGQKLTMGKAYDTREQAEECCQAFVDKLRATFVGGISS